MQTINLDLSVRSIIPQLHAKQGDVGRKFKAILTDGGAAYPVPAGAAVSVWYSGASGEGNYTDIGAGSAVSVSGNEITVELITQMLTNYGAGSVCLVINAADGDQLGTWSIPYMVEPLPGMGSAAAQQYFTAFSQAVQNLPYPDTTLTISGRAADAGAVGNRFANLKAEDVGARPNTWLPTIDEISAAPAGYGLGIGQFLPDGTDLNTIRKNGWYFWNTAVNAYDTRFNGMRVWTMDGGACMQESVALSNDVYWGTWIRRMIYRSDTVTPWEYINPPMVLGGEYRTTERWNGKVVYTKLVNCGNLPAAGEKTVSVLPESYKIIHCEGCTTDGWAMPVISDGDCRVTAFGSSVRFAATRDFSWMSADVTLRYVKD